MTEMPPQLYGQLFNGCNEPCDMLEGPCACGAWHHLADWEARAEKESWPAWTVRAIRSTTLRP